MKQHRLLDDWLPVVFVAFALLAATSLWHEAASPSSTAAITQA